MRSRGIGDRRGGGSIHGRKESGSDNREVGVNDLQQACLLGAWRKCPYSALTQSQ